MKSSPGAVRPLIAPGGSQWTLGAISGRATPGELFHRPVLYNFRN